MADPVFQINPDLNPAALRAIFAEGDCLQISEFLDQSSINRLVGTLSDVSWNLVMNDRERHIDLPVAQLPSLGLERIQRAIQQARARAATEFQYVYENFPVADAFQNGHLKGKDLGRFFTFMNSKPVRTFLEQVTGHSIDFCDMQLTKYGPGHVLTQHDDGIEGKNRKFAYVLSLTPEWRAIWGGQLQFLTDDGQISRSFIPAFNTLSIFSVPVPHHVTEVASFAPHSRVSMTGWFRVRGD